VVAAVEGIVVVAIEAVVITDHNGCKMLITSVETATDAVLAVFNAAKALVKEDCRDVIWELVVVVVIVVVSIAGIAVFVDPEIVVVELPALAISFKSLS